MTAIITKQNVKNGAFTGGTGGGSSNGEFETIHVKGDAIIDGKLSNEKIDDFESRISNLELNHDNDNGELTYETGLDDFIIDVNTLSTSENDECNILEIAFTVQNDYTGDVFEILWPSNMGLPNTIISATNGKFANPKILFVDSKYSSTTITDDSTPKIYLSKDIIDMPMNLFTSGFIRINYIAKTKQNVNSKDNQIINFKCNQIDADNCFKL